MSAKLTREAFRKLIAEDLAWLNAQPRTLEREHIELGLKELEAFHYDLPALLQEVIDAVNNHPHLEAFHGSQYREPLNDDLHDRVCAWIEKLGGPRGA